MSTEWVPLHLSERSEAVPQLYSKYSFHSTGYSVFITDLVSIWSEELRERSQIDARAAEEDTSIDPTEDGGRQIKQFLSLIRQALDCDVGTSRYIHQGDSREPLVLRTETPIHGSAPLRWSFNFSQLPQKVFTENFVVPLLNASATCKKDVDSLILHLAEKDHVIGKLIDALEATGHDLSGVFPSATQRRGQTKNGLREFAGRHVKGLGIFHETDWRLAKDSEETTVKTLNDLVEGSYLKASTNHTSNPDFTIPESGWQLSIGSDVHARPREVTYGRLSSVAGVGRSDFKELSKLPTDDDTDDEFQTQEPLSKNKTTSSAENTTKSQSPVIGARQDDDDTTEDEGIVDEPITQGSQSRTINTTIPANTYQSSLNFVSGSNKVSHDSETIDRVEIPGMEDKDIDTDGNFDNGDSLQETKSSPSTDPNPRSISQKPSQPPQKAKLGVVGGRKRVDASDDGVSNVTRSPKRHGVIGRIGGLHKSMPSNEGISSQSASTEPDVKTMTNDDVTILAPAMDVNELPVNVSTPIPDETPEQKAERRRRELKHELEAKQQAPTKKKRRF